MRQKKELDYFVLSCMHLFIFTTTEEGVQEKKKKKNYVDEA